MDEPEKVYLNPVPKIEPGINLESEDADAGKNKKTTKIANAVPNECHANVPLLYKLQRLPFNEILPPHQPGCQPRSDINQSKNYR